MSLLVILLTALAFTYMWTMFFSGNRTARSFAFHEPSVPHDAAWSGWTRLEKLFVFGDSWAEAPFNPRGLQPCLDNPFGNPVYPLGRNNGPLWPDFLTLTYNASLVRTFNFARGGALVDKKVPNAAIGDESLSFRGQVDYIFRPIYGSKSTPALLTWNPRSSLFAIQFGVNDLNDALKAYEHLAVDLVIASFADTVTRLYETGARNFLFFNIPPFHRPMRAAGFDTTMLTEDIEEYNKQLLFFKESFANSHADVTVFFFDTYSFFTRLLERTKHVPQTSRLLNVTNVCDTYMFGGNNSTTTGLGRG